MLRENVEDEHRAVDDRERHDLFEIRALARSKIVEHEDRVGVERFGSLRDLGGFAAPDERRWIDVRELLNDFTDDDDARGADERRKFGQLRLEWCRPVTQVDGDEQRSLRSVDDGAHHPLPFRDCGGRRLSRRVRAGRGYLPTLTAEDGGRRRKNCAR